MFSGSGTSWKIKLLTDTMVYGKRLSGEFFIRDVLTVAQELPGKTLVIRFSDGSYKRFQITEVEAYRGREDKACHACKGRTSRTEIMFHKGGCLYLYLVYGIYWMLNIVTGAEDDPQAVLIRGVDGYCGPGKLTKSLGIDGSYYGEDLESSARIWIEDSGFSPIIKTGTRIGIDYAGEYWKNRPWRFYI